jgi:uncharacterized protein (TIGR01777 family)
MSIVIAGGTGFLGRALTDALARDGHDIVILTRQQAAPDPAAPRVRTVAWTPDGEAGPWAAALDHATVVINLAGESIANGRWTAARKQRIVNSRVLATRSLATAIGRAAHPPAVFVSGSAVGYYGPLGDEIVTEERRAGSDFLAQVCVRWEDEARRIDPAHTRLACIRTGLVLERDGGALPQMLLPFRFGAGGPVGSGRQYWPWIHRRDWVNLVRFVIETPGASGAVNATAPNPVTSAQFAKALGRVMHRPAILPAPAFALKLMLGEMAEALLLSGQRAVPAKAEALGFAFTHTNVEEALRSILSSRGDGRNTS